MEKRTGSGSLVKSVPGHGVPARAGAPAVRAVTIAATAFAVAGAGGFLSLLLAPTLLGGIVMVAGFISSAGLLIATLLARKGAVPATAGVPQGVSDEDFMSLKRDLGRLRFQEGLTDRGERAYEQFSQSAERFKRFTRLLSEKFSEGEITYARYHGAGTQAYLAILDNLRSVASILNNVSVIKTGDETNPGSDAIRERLENRERQLAKAEEIFGLNETGLTAFDRMNEAIAGIKTSSGWSGTEMQETLKELERLAERAPKYSI